MRQDLIVLRALSLILFMLFLIVGREWATSENNIQHASTYNKVIKVNSIRDHHNYTHK